MWRFRSTLLLQGPRLTFSSQFTTLDLIDASHGGNQARANQVRSITKNSICKPQKSLGEPHSYHRTSLRIAYPFIRVSPIRSSQIHRHVRF
jgi:hypothetical protein